MSTSDTGPKHRTSTGRVTPDVVGGSRGTPTYGDRGTVSTRQAPRAARNAPPTRPELLRRRAELQRELAAVDEALAALEERVERASAPAGWISQRSSPLGKSKFLLLWRRLRDEGAEGARASGKLRLIRVDVFDACLAAADEASRRRRPTPAESGVDLAAAFGVSP